MVMELFVYEPVVVGRRQVKHARIGVWVNKRNMVWYARSVSQWVNSVICFFSLFFFFCKVRFDPLWRLINESSCFGNSSRPTCTWSQFILFCFVFCPNFEKLSSKFALDFIRKKMWVLLKKKVFLSRDVGVCRGCIGGGLGSRDLKLSLNCEPYRTKQNDDVIVCRKLPMIILLINETRIYSVLKY